MSEYNSVLEVCITQRYISHIIFSHKNEVLKIGDFYETKVNKNGYNFMIYIWLPHCKKDLIKK